MTATMTEDRDRTLGGTAQDQQVQRPALDDPEAAMRRYGLLFFFLLGLYAVAFVMLGVWLSA
jgi:hypothetical protein